MLRHCITLIIVFFLPVLVSCKQKLQDKEDKTIFIPLIDKKVVSINDIFEEIKYIPLETNNFSLLGDIANPDNSQLILKNEYIYITYLNSPLFIFDITGRWIRTIDRKGQGPEEYLRIISFDISNNNEIAVLDDVGIKKILFYSWEGKFMKSTTYQGIYQNPRSVNYMNDSLLVIFTPPGRSTGFKFNILNRNTLSFVNSYWPTFLRQFHVTLKNNVVEYQGKIIFFEPQNPRIYELTDDCASLRYIINVGDKIPPEYFWEIKDLTWAEIVERNIYASQVQEQKEKGYIDNIMFFSEAPETILLQFSETAINTFDGTYTLFNKISKNSILIDKIAFDSHFVWKPSKMYSRSDGIVIIPIPAEILLDSGEGEIRKLFPNLLEDDNPILCIGKLR